MEVCPVALWGRPGTPKQASVGTRMAAGSGDGQSFRKAQTGQTRTEQGVLLGIGLPQSHTVNEEQQNTHWHSRRLGDWQLGD